MSTDLVYFKMSHTKEPEEKELEEIKVKRVNVVNEKMKEINSIREEFGQLLRNLDDQHEQMTNDFTSLYSLISKQQKRYEKLSIENMKKIAQQREELKNESNNLVKDLDNVINSVSDDANNDVDDTKNENDEDDEEALLKYDDFTFDMKLDPLPQTDFELPEMPVLMEPIEKKQNIEELDSVIASKQNVASPTSQSGTTKDDLFYHE